MSRYEAGEYDWDDPEFMAWRDRLVTVIPELDDLFDEIRLDNHKGTCWDLINDLAMVLTYSKAAPPTKPLNK